MAGDADSSDDDIEIVPKSVDNYWLEHGDETPVSFASLPYFTTGEPNPPNKLVYVRGTQDNGMRLYMKAVAWKLEFSKDIKPVFRLKTEKYWIELKKPRKSFETTIRSIMSTAVFLNYALLNPGDPEKVAWNHVKNVYKSWDVAPRRNDLASHLLVIRQLIESNERLASACALQTIHTGLSRKRLVLAREHAQQSSELHQYKYEKEHLDDEEELDTCRDDLGLEVGDLAETVCCICDDGGDMICCDGPCMRSFHFKGASNSCSTLGLSKIDVDRLDKFFCPNCKFKIHQCYACGELGCSDDASGAACEVFLCGADMCGHFYHPSCVAKLVLKDKDTSEQVAMADSIKEGKGFVCPVHNCWKCGKAEVKEAKNLQFGICRRCPRVWHRQCLPLSLLHDDPKRCWYGLLPNKILVYCKRHTVIPALATPARNHVKFPESSMPAVHKRMVKRKAEEEGKKSKPSTLGSFKKKSATNLKSPDGHTAAKLLGKKRKPFSPLKQMKPEAHEPTKSKPNQGDVAPCSSMAKVRDRLPAVNLVNERTNVGFSVKQELSSPENEQKCNSPIKGRSNLDANLGRTSVVVAKSPTPGNFAPLTPHPLPQRNEALVYKASSVDKETKSMVDDIIERAKASVTIESVLMKNGVLEGSTQNRDRIYSLFKLESTIKEMSKAVETLGNGGSIEDAKLQGSPDYISYIKSCTEDLKFYLAPLLHGARHTPYGQHFTKPEKLKVIVDRLHWYLEEGDMIVDFACGSSDFFLLMKKKMEESGKACEYRSFDQTSNDFNFSKLDCFEVKPSELPDGDRLIIRLNPPLGHRTNQFIDHALIFRPKLIVLTVPKEVQSLDQKYDMYDLVWEDSNLLGSVDVDDNSLNDWNNEPRLLYFWSRPDWTLKYKQIALDQGHISPLSSSHFTGGPWKASSPQPPLNSDFDMEKNRNDEAAVELGGGEEEMGNLGKSKYDRSQGESVIVNESFGEGDTIGDPDKRLSSTLQVEHMIVNEPTGGQVTVSNQHTSNASKLDQIMRRRELLECDGTTFDTQVNDNSLKSHKVKTTTDNDGFVPLKRRTNMKRKGVDSSIEKPSGSQFNQYSSQESPEKARNSSRHGVTLTVKKTNDKYICGDDKKNDELAHDGHPHKMITGKKLDNKEADLGGRKSPNSKNDDYMNSELPKSVLWPDNAAQYEFVNRNFHGQEALRAQGVQRQDPLIGCNTQMPGCYNGAASVTLNRHSGFHLPYPPSRMHDINYTSNRYGTEHPFGSSGAGRVHVLPEFQRSHQYIVPSNIIPQNPAPFYHPSGPVHLPPGYGYFQPNHYAPLGFQHNFLPIQPQYPPFPERPPNQTNTGGWFDD